MARSSAVTCPPFDLSLGMFICSSIQAISPTYQEERRSERPFEYVMKHRSSHDWLLRDRWHSLGSAPHAPHCCWE